MPKTYQEIPKTLRTQIEEFELSNPDFDLGLFMLKVKELTENYYSKQ